MKKLGTTIKIQNWISQKSGFMWIRNLFHWKEGPWNITLNIFSACNSVQLFFASPEKLDYLYFCTVFFTIWPLTNKIGNWQYFNIHQWKADLLIEYKYVEQNMNRARDIGVQSWPFRSQKIARFSPKIWLWRQVPENWQVTRGFILWLFLSWSIDYRTKIQKHDLEESLLGLLATLFPTVDCGPSKVSEITLFWRKID